MAVSLHLQEKSCYICGNVGFEELLATCMDCKTIFIHVYCMKKLQVNIPEDWICEDCHGTPKQGKRYHASPEKACKKVEVPKKIVENNTNIPLATSVIKCNVHVSSPEKPSGLSMEDQSKCKKNSVHAHITSAPEFSKRNCIQDPVHACTPSSYCKRSPDLESFKELFIPTQPASTKSRRGFVQGGDPYKGTLRESKNARVQKTISFERPTTVDRYLPNHPSSIATWKGCFKTSGFSPPVSSSVDVWGYPPAKVGKKAYEFSKNMPIVLRFEAISRCTLWTNMFNNEGPDKYDIGLYFFPTGGSSEQPYSSLVSHLEKEDIVLKSTINGIELLIFSSSLLDEKSKEINQACYLWGLFVPHVITTFKEPDQAENEQAVDMEIDMVGAVAAGRIKDEAPTDYSVSGSKITKAQPPSSATQVKLEKWDGEELASPPGFAASGVELSFPPGFEEAWRVKYKTIAEILGSKYKR